MPLFDPSPYKLPAPPQEEEEDDDPLSLTIKAAEEEADRQQASRSSGDTYQYQGQNPNWMADAADEEAGRRAATATPQKSPEKPPAPVQIQKPEERKTTARDGQSLSGQSIETQSAFRLRYSQDADWQWVKEHEAELDNIARGLPAKPPGATPVVDSGTKSATLVSAQPPAAVQPKSGAAVTTAAPGSKPWFQSGWTPAPTDRVTVYDAATGRTKVITGSAFLASIRYTGASMASYNAIRAVEPGTDPSALELDSWEGDGPKPSSTATAPAPTTSNAQQAPSALSSPSVPGQTPTGPTTRTMSNRVVTPSEEARQPDLPSDGELPLSYLARSTGQSPEKIAQGVASLMKGDQSATWVQPYLYDVARMAWAKQERSQGRNVSPLDAPVDYIESWLDAFYGSDTSVPLVKELDQQMMDYAATQTVPGGPFNWRVAFGETGEKGLISRQVTDRDCGTNSFANVLRSLGYNIDPGTAYQYGKTKGYHDGEQFTGPYNFSRMLREEAGVNAQTIPINWNEVDKQLDAGKVVVLSSGGHYWTVASRREGPNGPEYYTGATGSVVGNPEWATAGQIRYGGAPNYMIVVDGNVNPQSRVVQETGIRAATPTPDRTLLSSGIRQQQQQNNRASTSSQGGYQTLQLSQSGDEFDWAAPYTPIIDGASKDYDVDGDLIAAVLSVESEGNPTAVSRAGARGLMQLMPNTARGLGVLDPMDPNQNVRGGAKYLRQLLDRYDGNLTLALAAYNAGPGNVDQAGGVPDFEETQKYVRLVQAEYQRRKAIRSRGR